MNAAALESAESTACEHCGEPSHACADCCDTGEVLRWAGGDVVDPCPSCCAPGGYDADGYRF